MGEFITYFKSPKNLINLAFLMVLVAGIPLGVGLVREQQVLKSQAGSGPIIALTGEGQCVKEYKGKLIVSCPEVTFQLNSPIGGPEGTPGPTATPSSSPGITCNPDEKDQNKIKQTWTPTKEGKCDVKKNEKKVTFECKYLDKKGKEKIKKKDLKVSCTTSSPTPIGSPTGCDPKAKDEQIRGGAWGEPIKQESKCDKKNQKKATFQCIYDDKGKQKLKKKDIKISCTATPSPSASATTSPTSCNPNEKSNEAIADTSNSKWVVASDKGIDCSTTPQVKVKFVCNYLDKGKEKVKNKSISFKDTTTYNKYCSGKKSPKPSPWVFNLQNILIKDVIADDDDDDNPSRRTAAPTGGTGTTSVSDRTGVTTSVRFGEKADFSDATEKTYDEEPLVVPYTFKDTESGEKFFFAEFIGKDKRGKDMTDKRSLKLFYVGTPPQIDNISCNPATSGSGINIEINGSGFGSEKGLLKARAREVSNLSGWTDSKITGFVDLPGNSENNLGSIKVELTRDSDGAEAQGHCGSSQLSLGVKLFCRRENFNSQKGVKLSYLEAGPDSELQTENVVIESDGLVAGLTGKFKIGQTYQLVIKAPKSLKRVSEPFIFLGGTQQIKLRKSQNYLDNIYYNVLPIGDIFPTSGDNAINSFDRQILKQEWGVASSSGSLKTADFNGDNVVNSVDWACMRYDFGESGDSDPTSVTPIVVATPSPTPTATPLVCASPPACNDGETLRHGDPLEGQCALYWCATPLPSASPTSTPLPTESPSPSPSSTP